MVSADRGLINGTRFGALKALRAFSILSFADYHHPFIALVPSHCVPVYSIFNSTCFGTPRR
ncbi:hypothetical protein MPLA_2130128 [Mesorhizobium sp. ORS 3359]|nr:hypothetical protein MPLA_2130128 [Mesorhizobium sp. ORS 3359]